MKKSKGFTLIEVLIATAILVMVGVSAIAVEVNFMNSGTRNKHKLQATGLAQEGMSKVRNVFTTNLLPTNYQVLSGGCYYINNDGDLKPDTQCIGAEIELNGIKFQRKIEVK